MAPICQKRQQARRLGRHTKHVWDWVEPSLQYGLSPLIAAGAVVLTQRRADRRENRRAEEENTRRLAELTRAEAQREREYKEGLDERWRDERKQAHSALLTLLIEAQDAVRHEVQWASGLLTPLEYTHYDQQLFDRIRVATAAIRLVASDASVAAATRCREFLWDFLMLAHGMHTDVHDWSPDDPRDLKELLANYLDALQRYEEAVRSELGTA